MAAAERLYKTMILTIFDYCDVAWQGCGKANCDVLESLGIELRRYIRQILASMLKS